MPISRQAVAKHLHHLQRAALVTSVRTGREIRYHLTVTPLARAVDWLEDVCGQVRRAA
jgi:predicted transcriptional regulator